MMLPEMQERVRHTCQDCIFLVNVIGKKESKTICVKAIPEYVKRHKKIRREISIYEILKYISSRQLINLVLQSSPYRMACVHFIKRT